MAFLDLSNSGAMLMMLRTTPAAPVQTTDVRMSTVRTDQPIAPSPRSEERSSTKVGGLQHLLYPARAILGGLLFAVLGMAVFLWVRSAVDDVLVSAMLTLLAALVLLPIIGISRRKAR